MRIGDYELLAQIDSDDVWVRYRARHSSDGSPLELRVLNRDANESVLWDRFFKRLMIIRLIAHPSLVRIVEIAAGQQPPFLVVDGPLGCSLRDALAERVPLPLEEALPLAAQLADAVATAHRFGVAHGGLTADRIAFVDSSVRLDLTEFVPTLQDDATSSTAFANDVRDCGRLLAWVTSPDRPETDRGFAGDEAPESAAVRDLIRRMRDDDPQQRPLMAEVAERLDHEAACLFSETIAAPPIPDAAARPGATSPYETPAEPSRKRAMRAVSAGDRLGRFHLLEELGQGGMGAVFRARDEADGTIVAVKVIRPDATPSGETLRRFRREAHVLAEVNNPYVTNLIEYNEDQGIPYLVMEFVAGQTLKQRLDREKKLDEPTAVAIVADVCRALSSAHRRGIVHRDIKPDNILLPDESVAVADGNRPPRVKLSDFGVARQRSDADATRLTRTGSAVGTPLYMSPEQCEDGGSADARSDVYSIGATLYHLLAGRPPFLANSFARLVRMHAEDSPPDLRTLDGSLTESVCRIVDRTLAKPPQQRFAGSDELLQCLECVQFGESFPAESHPQPPAAGDAGVVTYSWSWDLNSSLAELWPHVSNTDRFNRAVGLPAVRFTESREADGRGQRFGRFSKLGVAVCWKEHPFEWVEGRQFGVLREYTQGPFRWMTSEVRLEQQRGGTRLTHTLRIKPSGLLGRLLCAVEIGTRTRRGFARVYRRIDDWLQRVGAEGNVPTTFDPPPPLTRQQWRMLETHLHRLRELDLPEATIEKLGDYLAEASPQEVARIRPHALARQLRIDADSLRDACLHAAHNGLLTLAWDILCPLCRVPAEMQSTLQAVRDHLYCPACDLDLAVDPAESIELVFRIHESIRSVDAQTYCVGGPAHLPHVVAQLRLAPGERIRLVLTLTPGHYAIRVTGEDVTDRLCVYSAAAADRAEWRRTSLGEHVGLDLKPGEQQIFLQNDSAQESVIRIERSANRVDAVVAAEALLLPLFRELFPNEAVTAESLREFPRLTVLAAGPSGQYRGQELATASLRRLKASIVDKKGTLIAQNGDQMLAVFYSAVAALNAVSTFAASSNSTAAIALCVAVHSGTVNVSHSGGELICSGEAIDVAREILRLAEPGGLLLSATVSTQAGVSALARTDGLEFCVLDRTPEDDPNLLLHRVLVRGENKTRQSLNLDVSR